MIGEQLQKTSTQTVESRAMAALKRLTDKTPAHPYNVARLAAGNRIVSVQGVAREAGVSRTTFGSKTSRLPHVFEAIRAAAAAEANVGLDEELKIEKQESRRLKRLLDLIQVQNASLQLEVARLRARVKGDDTVTPFRQNRRTRKR